MTNPVAAIQKLYSETIRELKKCTWPTRKELFELKQCFNYTTAKIKSTSFRFPIL